MTAQPDEDRLVAYVDNELDAEERREVEELIATNGEARRRVAELRRSAALLRGALDEVSRRPMPRDLYRLLGVDAAPLHEPLEPCRRASCRRARRPSRAAVAASIAMISIGGIGGYLAKGLWSERDARGATDSVAARHLVDMVVAEVLEKELSGVTFEWSGREGRFRAAVTPVRTFRSAGGEWCREYRELLQMARTTETRRGVACRIGEREWKTQLAVRDGS